MQRIQVSFPALTAGKSQPPVTPSPEEYLTPISGLCRYLYSRVHAHRERGEDTQIHNEKIQNVTPKVKRDSECEPFMKTLNVPYTKPSYLECIGFLICV